MALEVSLSRSREYISIRERAMRLRVCAYMDERSFSFEAVLVWADDDVVFWSFRGVFGCFF